MGIDKFDNRLVSRKIRKGDMSADEHAAHLASLPDLSDNLDIVEAQVGVGEDEVDAGDEAGEEVEAAEEAEA